MHAGLSWRRGSVEQSRIGCLEYQLLHLLVEHATQEPITLRIDLSYYFIVGRPQAVFVQVHLFVPGECRVGSPRASLWLLSSCSQDTATLLPTTAVLSLGLTSPHRCPR